MYIIIVKYLKFIHYNKFGGNGNGVGRNIDLKISMYKDDAWKPTIL